MLFNWYLIIYQGFFSTTIMKWIARSYKIGLFQIYSFTKGGSHPLFVHPDALLQCKKQLDEVILSKWTLRQWMLSCIPLNIRGEYIQRTLGSKKMSFLHFLKCSDEAEQMTLLLYSQMWCSCSVEKKQEWKLSACVGPAEKCHDSLQTLCIGRNWRIPFVGCRKEKDFFNEPL